MTLVDLLIYEKLEQKGWLLHASLFYLGSKNFDTSNDFINEISTTEISKK